MKKTNWIVVALTASVMLAGCSSAPSKKDLAEDEARAAEVRAHAASERRAADQKHVESTLAQVPGWALNPPKPDGEGVYAVGIGESDTLRIALRKATLEAEFGLAKVYSQELSGSERIYSRDDNSHVSGDQYTALIDKLVSQVPVVGFEVVKQEIVPFDGKFNVYVLLKLPYSQFNRVLQDQIGIAKAKDAAVAKSFAELEARLDKRRLQRIEESKQHRDSSLETKIDRLPGQEHRAQAETSLLDMILPAKQAVPAAEINTSAVGAE